MKTPKINNPNDYAFPFDRPQLGLTKREYFAAMAMQGLCANPNILTVAYNADGTILGQAWNRMLYNTAVTIADGQIAELNKPTQTKGE